MLAEAITFAKENTGAEDGISQATVAYSIFDLAFGTQHRERGFTVGPNAAYVNDPPLSWIARDSSKPRRPQADCWVLHASLTWSAEHLEDTPKAVCDRLLPALSSAVGIDDLRPIHAAAHRWRYAFPVEPLSVGCLWEAATRVAVCGDWCQAGRIEGAFLSGLAAAERIRTAFAALE